MIKNAKRSVAEAMEYEIIREPFLFMETMEMLHKHVSRFRYPSLWAIRRDRGGPEADKTVLRRLEQLQSIMEEVCRDVDVSDPLLRRYFAPIGTEYPLSCSYLARFMVSACLTYAHTGFEETAADILEAWEQGKRIGAWLHQMGDCSLAYTRQPGSPGDLFAQVCALELPAEFRLQLYGVLHRFPEALAELTELMRPLARRLEEALAGSDLDVGELARYWLNQHQSPLEFLGNSIGPEAVADPRGKVRLAISLMDPNRIYFDTDQEPEIKREYSYLYIGCGISASSLLQEYSNAIDDISSVLRGLSERKRLEVLRQLAKKRLYGQELAELLNMDRGNLSRLLSVLNEQGFVRQEKENQRIYYRADRQALQRFFDGIVGVLFD